MADILHRIGRCRFKFEWRCRIWLVHGLLWSPCFWLILSHLRLTRSEALDGIYLAFNSIQQLGHWMGVLIGNQCMAQTAASPLSCITACSPQPVVLTHPMAWAAFLKCCSPAKLQAVTLSKICLPSYIGRFDNLVENPPLPHWPGVSSVEAWKVEEPAVG